MTQRLRSVYSISFHLQPITIPSLPHPIDRNQFYDLLESFSLERRNLPIILEFIDVVAVEYEKRAKALISGNIQERESFSKALSDLFDVATLCIYFGINEVCVHLLEHYNRFKRDNIEPFNTYSFLETDARMSIANPNHLLLGDSAGRSDLLQNSDFFYGRCQRTRFITLNKDSVLPYEIYSLFIHLDHRQADIIDVIVSSFRKGNVQYYNMLFSFLKNDDNKALIKDDDDRIACASYLISQRDSFYAFSRTLSDSERAWFLDRIRAFITDEVICDCVFDRPFYTWKTLFFLYYVLGDIDRIRSLVSEKGIPHWRNYTNIDKLNILSRIPDYPDIFESKINEIDFEKICLGYL